MSKLRHSIQAIGFHNLLLLGVMVAAALALAGCEALDDLRDQLIDTHVPKPPASKPADRGEPCGPNVCAVGQVCCNPSCGVCTEPGGGCTKQLCPPKPGPCATDADCRTYSDYCTGCDCRALSRGEPEPICQGPGVQCLVDPCRDQKAICLGGQCTLAGGTPAPPPPSQLCEKRVQGGPTSCKTSDIWKRSAYEDCKNSGLNLTEIYPQEDCGGGATRSVVYVCCSI